MYMRFQVLVEGFYVIPGWQDIVIKNFPVRGLPALSISRESNAYVGASGSAPVHPSMPDGGYILSDQIANRQFTFTLIIMAAQRRADAGVCSSLGAKGLTNNHLRRHPAR